MMKSLAFLCSKNTLFGIMIGFALASLLAFKIMSDPPNCAISLDKMNVFYLGVENPIKIVVRGVPVEQVVVKAAGVVLKKVEGDRYTVTAATPGEASITVSGGDLEPTTFRYRVKMIPNPVPRLSTGDGKKPYFGNIRFKSSVEIAAVLENFDFDARCEVLRYKITYISKDQDPVTIFNTGGRFNAEALYLISKAQPGDQYFFDEVKVKCPGDVAARDLGSLAYKIK